ncbi:hypothetical protein vseg_003179 [Gypsophila vaccaria]
MAYNIKGSLAIGWSELPQGVISNIVRRLDSAVDVFQLRSVCKNWHSCRNPDNISILSPFLPRIISNVTLPFVDRPNDPVILIARAVFLVKPLRYATASRGWLLTVEEMVPGKLRILYPLSIDHVGHLPSNCPKYLDLSKFKVSQLAKTYGFKYVSDEKAVPGVRRVVMCAETTAMVLYGGGTLIGMRLKCGIWNFVRRRNIICSFSDVISYDENHVLAINREGNVHIINHKAIKVVKTISFEPGFDRSSRLVLLTSNGEIFVVACATDKTLINFSIFQLNEVKCNWKNVGNKYCCGKVVFVSSDWSFFLYTNDLDLCYYSPREQPEEDVVGWDDEKETICGDYVIYSEISFDLSLCCSDIIWLYEKASVDLLIGVFFINPEDVYFWRRADCSSKVIDVLWPTPAWFWTETYLSASHHSSPCSAEASTSTKVITKNKESTHLKDCHAVTLFEKESPRVSFHGIEIQSEHLPVLLQVWKKHGDVFEGSLLQSHDAKAMALACLVKILIILQAHSEGFDNDQATYVETTLADLKLMRLNICWLVPYLEKVLAHHKQLQADLLALEEAKSKADKTGERLLAVMAEVKRGLGKDT